jgi:hypothetical protein
MKHVLDFGPVSEASLKRLADAHGLSREDAIIRAVALFSALTDEEARGNEVVLRTPDGTIRELNAA